MNMSSLGLFVTSRRARSAILELLPLPVVMRRQRPPVSELSDHLRRDMGLPRLGNDSIEVNRKGKSWSRV